MKLAVFKKCKHCGKPLNIKNKCHRDPECQSSYMKEIWKQPERKEKVAELTRRIMANK